MSEESLQQEVVEDAAMEQEQTQEPSEDFGSGDVSGEVQEESGLQEPIAGEDAEALDQLADDVEQAVADGASDEEIQDLIETFKIKVNGKEKEVQLDWNNKEDIVRRLQMAEAGQTAMQKAAEYEKGFESFMQNAKENPWDVLSELGLDPDELAERRIQQRIEELQKSPEQLAAEQRDRELEELRRKIKEQEEEREKIEFERMQAQAEANLDAEITEALSATSELPKSPYVVKRIADAMLTAIQNGYDDVTPTDVLPWVQKEINEEMQGLFSSMPDQVLEQYLGAKTIDRLRQNRLKKMNQPKSPKNIQETGAKPQPKKEPKKKIKLTEWLKHGNSITDL